MLYATKVLMREALRWGEGHVHNSRTWQAESRKTPLRFREAATTGKHHLSSTSLPQVLLSLSFFPSLPYLFVPSDMGIRCAGRIHGCAGANSETHRRCYGSLRQKAEHSMDVNWSIRLVHARFGDSLYISLQNSLCDRRIYIFLQRDFYLPRSILPCSVANPQEAVEPVLVAATILPSPVVFSSVFIHSSLRGISRGSMSGIGTPPYSFTISSLSTLSTPIISTI